MPLAFLPLIYLALEVVALLLVGQYLGMAWTLLLFFGSSLIGLGLLRQALRKAPDRWLHEIQTLGVAAQGRAALQPILIALLLIVPGFITDLLALYLALRRLWVSPSQGAEPDARDFTDRTNGQPGVNRRPGQIIEGEYQDLDNDDKKN